VWVTGGFDFRVRRFAFREDENVADHVADAFDLLADAGLGWARASGRTSGRSSVSAERLMMLRIFQVVDDGRAKLPTTARPFGLDNFTEVRWLNSRRRWLMCCTARTPARASVGERKHFAARKEINVRVLDRGGGGRARAMFDHGHFAENFPGAELGKDAPGAGTDETGNFHQPVFDEIDAHCRDRLRGKFHNRRQNAVPGDKTQRLQLVAAQIAKQGNGFKRGTSALI